MSNKLYSTVGSMIALSAFHAAQGMDERQVSPEHEQKFIHVRVELKERVKEIHKVKDNFRFVFSDLIKYDPPYYGNGEVLNLLEQERDQVLRTLLLELSQEEESEQEDGYEIAQAFGELFGQAFAGAEEEIAQNDAFEKMGQSLVGMESLLQEAKKDVVEEVQPVKVGYWTSFKDWYYGPSNLVADLKKEEVSLDVLKKSPDMQQRVNSLIASCSPSKNRDSKMLGQLVDLYGQLNQLNFKFVNSGTNSDIHNACKQWQREEELLYAAQRKIRVMAIATLLKSELQKMVKDEEPRNNIIMTLEEVQRLTKTTGMVEESDDKLGELNVEEPKLFDIVSHLEALCEELQQEQAGK